MASCISLQNVDQDHDNKTLTVTWIDGDKQVYPYIWLRDNCQCPTVCWHESGIVPKSGSRYNIDVEVIPKTLEFTGANSSSKIIDIEWSDGHKSQYESSWLRQYRFDDSPPDATFYPTLRYWGADVGEKQMKKFDYDDIMTSDESLLEWLLELKELGITLIVGAPTSEGQLYEIGKRVSFLHSNCYGRIWTVRAKFNGDGVSHENVAKQRTFLPLHTDHAYYQRPPGVLMFHCLQPAPDDGGLSIAADGFKVAEEIKKENKDAFDLLTSTIFKQFNWERHATDFSGKCHHESRHSVIKLGPRGEIQRVALTHHRRDPMLQIPVSQVLPAYRALKMFNDKLYDPANLFKLKLREGDMLFIDNHRVLHGRTDFEITKTTDRHFEGAYVEWDQVNSRISVLQKELQKKK